MTVMPRALYSISMSADHWRTKDLQAEYTESSGAPKAEKLLKLMTAPRRLVTMPGNTALVTLSMELMLRSTKAWHLVAPSWISRKYSG